MWTRPEHHVRRRRARILPALVTAAAVVLVASSCGGARRAGHPGATRTVAGRPAATAAPRRRRRPSPFARPLSAPHLAPGSHPSALPGPILIADRSNNRLLVVDPQGRIRWEFPRPGDLRHGQSFLLPDDAFFANGGKWIVATEEDDFVISIIDVATHRIVYRYGRPGVAGSGPNRLWNPDDAMLLPGRRLLTADIKNCRLLLIRLPQHRPEHVYGVTTNACYHAPPQHWASPNGAFPMRNGHFLVTEIDGSWVDELTLGGRVLRSWHPPGVVYPSDSNEVKPGVYVTAGYTYPGMLETFDGLGRLLWRYQPRPGDPPLDHPSLALPLPNGDFLLNDDYNDRIVVVDPRNDRIVWQYGHTGVPGRQAGYLSQPDGVDLAPPHSLLLTHRAG